jgi:hypothetical protein
MRLMKLMRICGPPTAVAPELALLERAALKLMKLMKRMSWPCWRGLQHEA